MPYCSLCRRRLNHQPMNLIEKTELRSKLVAATGSVQNLPYVWPGEPTSASASQQQQGTCASKHALLAEHCDALGILTSPLLVIGRLVPPRLAQQAPFAGESELLEVHECLTVVTPWSGPFRVDITWAPPLIAAGLAGTRDWDGKSDMPLAIDAIGPGWAVERTVLRDAKLALRKRIYQAGEAARRAKILRALSDLFLIWRRQA